VHSPRSRARLGPILLDDTPPVLVERLYSAQCINSVDANGKPNGVMGVPANHKPSTAPLIPWGSTTLLANSPANTNIASF